MDRILGQLGIHPFFASVAVSILVIGIVLVALRRSEGSALLPKMTALALLAWSFGIASSVQTLLNVFHAMALVGSGGYGAVAAGFSEVQWAILIGLASAFLTLSLGLIVSLTVPPGSQVSETGAALKPMPAWILILLAVVAAAVVALTLHRNWLLRLATAVALAPKGAPPPVAGSVGEISQRIANHLIFLGFAAHGMILGCAALLIALFVSGRRTLTHRRVIWLRLLAALLLFLALGGMVALWRQLDHLAEIAMVGKPF